MPLCIKLRFQIRNGVVLIDIERQQRDNGNSQHGGKDDGKAGGRAGAVRHGVRNKFAHDLQLLVFCWVGGIHPQYNTRGETREGGEEGCEFWLPVKNRK